MIKQLKNIDVVSVLTLFLIVFFGTEAFNKMFTFHNQDEIWIQKGVKLVLFIFVLLLLLVQKPTALLKLASIASCFLIGYYFLPEEFKFSSIIGMSRYLFFLSLIFLSSKPKLNFSKINLLENIFEILILFNSILILLGFLFRLEVFHSYSGERFGYNGLFMASSTSTYFYIITYIYFINRYRTSIITNWKFWLAIIASCFLGTKSIYICLILFFLSIILSFSYKRRYKLIFSTLLLCAGVVGAIVFFTTGLFNKIIQNEGWLTAILSRRDTLFIEKTMPYIQENWRPIHYFIGGISNYAIRPQLELIDLWLSFGIVGTFLFLFYFYKNFFTFSIKNNLIIVGFIILFLVSFIAGNFFYNASVPIYLIVLKISLRSNTEKNFPKSKEYQ